MHLPIFNGEMMRELRITGMKAAIKKAESFLTLPLIFEN